MKFCSFFQIVFSFFFYTVKADWGGPCPSPFLKEVICVIEVKNLVKRYGDHYAVNHLSFTVEDGQIFGFLGPNGAGKSTTMNIMTGYLAATEGQVLVEGHDILEEPEGMGWELFRNYLIAREERRKFLEVQWYEVK